MLILLFHLYKPLWFTPLLSAPIFIMYIVFFRKQSISLSSFVKQVVGCVFFCPDQQCSVLLTPSSPLSFKVCVYKECRSFYYLSITFHQHPATACCPQELAYNETILKLPFELALNQAFYTYCLEAGFLPNIVALVEVTVCVFQAFLLRCAVATI